MTDRPAGAAVPPRRSGAVGVLAVGVHGYARLLGARWLPPAVLAAAWVMQAGAGVHMLALGLTDALPDCTARAAATASIESDLPWRRRVRRLGPAPEGDQHPRIGLGGHSRPYRMLSREASAAR